MKDEISQIIINSGIKDFGFCDFDYVKNDLIDCRAKSRLPNNSKTVIVCLFPYKVKEKPPKFLSRYAALPDYHKVCGSILKNVCLKLFKKYPNNKFECFCDNSPIPEVLAASVSGLGAKGDNGLLITKKYGSFVFIGEIVTDIEIKTTNLYSECSHCGKCKTACPVSLDKTNCLSNLSQKKHITEKEMFFLKKNNILWGCDICINACPQNLNAEKTYIKEFINGYRDCYSLTEDDTDRPYTWRGTEVIKRNYKNLMEQI